VTVRRSGVSRVTSALLAAALLLGCAQLLGLKEDVAPGPCEVALDCAKGQVCIDLRCRDASDEGGSHAGGKGSGGADANRAGEAAGGDSRGGSATNGAGESNGGGDTSVGGDAGGSGPNPECDEPEDCAGVDSACATRTCKSGKCGVDFAKPGTVLAEQLEGDCQQALCDGDGAIVHEPDNQDVPTGSNPCMVESCSDGTPKHEPAPKTKACGETLQFKCDGNGACGGCTSKADCGLDNLCATYACNNNVCKNTFVASGQGNLANTAGDCKKNVCDGMGSPVAIADGSDLPVDNLPCTKDVCTDGAPSHPAENAGKACGAFSSCNGSGACNCSDPAANACPRLGAQCGTVTNGCGQQVTCTNTCSGVNTCNGAGNPNLCGCTPNAFNCGFMQCGGTISDGCGRTKDCSGDCQSLCPDNCQTKSCTFNGANGFCDCRDCNG